MKLIVVSDTHGRAGRMKQIKERHPDADGLLFLGDGASEMRRFDTLYPLYYAVRGNCDVASRLDDEQVVSLGGVDVLLAHGHLWRVKWDLLRLALRAREVGARVALFGHTHQPLATYEQGVFLMNPGALERGSYAVLTLSPDAFSARHYNLNDGENP